MIPWLLTGLLLLASLWNSPQAISADAVERYAIRLKRPDDSVSTTAMPEAGIRFDIHSPSGIGQAVIERRLLDWPKSVQLRLHLRGLEEFRVSNGLQTVQVSCSSTNMAAVPRQSLDADERTPLTADHPCYLKIERRMIDGAMTNQVYDITLPPGFLNSATTAITANWIDFYR